MVTTIQKRDLIEKNLGLALGKLEPSVEMVARWTFVLPSPDLASGTAALEDDWLVLSIPVSSCSGGRTPVSWDGPWSLAVRNGELGGGSKLRVEDDRRSVHLRNEIWVGNVRQAAAVIDSGCRLFREGISTLAERTDPGNAGQSGTAPSATTGTMADLMEMASGEGWNLEERDGGDLVTSLDLGVRGGYQIRLRPEPDGHLHAWSVILPELEPDSVNRQALGVLLARANDRLRLVRGVVHQGGGKDSVHFEVLQRAPFGPEQIKLMLSSLTAACWMCGPEIRLLTGRAVAQRYLESFGAAQLVNPT